MNIDKGRHPKNKPTGKQKMVRAMKATFICRIRAYDQNIRHKPTFSKIFLISDISNNDIKLETLVFISDLYVCL